MKHGINLALRAPNVLYRLRAAAGSEENVTQYYQLLQQIVQDFNIDVSKNVGNLDETFVRFDMKNRRVITERNAIRPSSSFQALLGNSWNTSQFWHL